MTVIGLLEWAWEDPALGLLSFVDGLIRSHEHRFGNEEDRLRFYRDLADFAYAPSADLRRSLATHLGPRDFNEASRAGCVCLAFAPIAILLTFRHPILMASYLVLIPLASLLDRLYRRRRAYLCLAEGKLTIYRKKSISPKEGKVFQSYWDAGTGELELDHPVEMYESVASADEFWTWQMPRPVGDSRGTKYSFTTYTIGMVRRKPDKSPEVILAGECYYDYDPVTGRNTN